jgi:hypothetical protein
MGWTKVQQENGDSAFAGGVNNLLLVRSLRVPWDRTAP